MDLKKNSPNISKQNEKKKITKWQKKKFKIKNDKKKFKKKNFKKKFKIKINRETVSTNSSEKCTLFSKKKAVSLSFSAQPMEKEIKKAIKNDFFVK